MPQALERDERHKRQELAMRQVLHRVAALQQDASSLATSAPSTTIIPMSCDNCGNPLSKAGDDVVYRRFEHGAFNAFCSGDCHREFLKHRQ